MPQHIDNTLRTQHRLIQAHRAQSDCLGIFNLLTDDLLFDELEQRLPDHRERLFPPTETLAMFVTQAMSADRSCQHAVNQAAIHRLVSGLPLCSTHTGGYCRARQRLPTRMVSSLTRYLGKPVGRNNQRALRRMLIGTGDSQSSVLSADTDNCAPRPDWR